MTFLRKCLHSQHTHTSPKLGRKWQQFQMKQHLPPPLPPLRIGSCTRPPPHKTHHTRSPLTGHTRSPLTGHTISPLTGHTTPSPHRPHHITPSQIASLTSPATLPTQNHRDKGEGETLENHTPNTLHVDHKYCVEWHSR